MSTHHPSPLETLDGRDLLGPFAEAFEAEDAAVVASSGYGIRRGFGGSPALVLVDFQHAYLGRDVPIAEQVGTHPSAGGAGAWAALRASVELLREWRERDLPRVLTRIAYSKDDSETNGFAMKRGNSASFVEGGAGTRLAAELGVTEGDEIITKPAASAFHDTPLEEHLRERQVDTLLVAGLSTSGCVRATVVDGVSRGFHVGVLVDCVADRVSLSHHATLLDVWMKYGDLITSQEAVRYVSGLRGQASP